MVSWLRAATVRWSLRISGRTESILGRDRLLERKNRIGACSNDDCGAYCATVPTIAICQSLAVAARFLWILPDMLACWLTVFPPADLFCNDAAAEGSCESINDCFTSVNTYCTLTKNTLLLNKWYYGIIVVWPKKQRYVAYTLFFYCTVTSTSLHLTRICLLDLAKRRKPWFSF